ncbi:MAG TPA: hypothetical protein VEI96_09660 [Thermodesulfovibrionales bacterium]|nr:hypothetical protein [Thermodesulfovibrionales bacterium]
MFRKIFVTALIVVAGVLAFGAALAYAHSGGTGDVLAYAYYDVRGAANYMVVNNSATTAPGCTMPLPHHKKVFTYTPVVSPVVSCDPAKAKPIGVGSIALGGDMIDVAVKIGPFEEPVDVSIGLFAASFDAKDIYFLNIFNQLTSLQEEIDEDQNAQVAADHGPGDGNSHGNNPKPKKNFRKLIPWKNDVLTIDETVFQGDLTDLPPGLYVIVLNVTRVSPSDDNFDRFYRWVTYFIVPDPAL